MIRAWAAAVLCALSLLGFGCADDDGPTHGLCGARRCPADCRALSTGSCDVLRRSCQERILDAVICVRGTEGVLPEIRVLTVSEFREEVEQSWSIDDDAGSDALDPDAGLVTQSVGTLRWSIALELLGLLAPDTHYASASIEESVQYVAGQYESDRERITLIDHGREDDSWGAQEAMAHELVHALQDQEIGLDEFYDRSPGSIDGRFSNGCLIEGDANLYGRLAWALLQGVTLDPEYWDRSLSSSLKSSRRHVLETESPYSAMWQLRYPIGTRYLLDAWLEGGNWGVQSIYDSPPTAGVHWLVGFEASRERETHLALRLACARAAVPDDYERYASYTLGAQTLFAFLGRTLRDGALLAPEAQWRNAMHWRFDDFSIFLGPEDAVAVSYRVRFDAAALAGSLARQLRQAARLPFVVRHDDDEIEVLAAEDPAILDDWHTDPDACPEPD